MNLLTRFAYFLSDRRHERQLRRACLEYMEAESSDTFWCEMEWWR